MDDGTAVRDESPGTGPADAVATLLADTTGLRAYALVAPGGAVIAESDPRKWSQAVASAWGAADDRGKPAPTQVHVATDEGELFLARDDEGVTAIAVTERFPLASLVFCDLRAALRRAGGER